MNRRSFMSNSLLGGAAAPSLAAKLLRARTKPEAGTPSLETNAAEGAAQKLFPTNLPERQWLEFRAHGFGQPAVGVIFRNGGSGQCGVPLGGIGTGYISLSLDGRLGEWTIFNNLVNPAKGEKMRWVPEPVSVPRVLNEPFLGLAVEGKTCVLALGKSERLDHAKGIHYWGHYPVADLEYELDSPVGVGLRAWAPFAPGDAALSNTPGAVFEVHLRNTAGSEKRGTIAFSFPGPAEYETLGKADFRRQLPVGEFQGVVVTSVRPGWPAFTPLPNVNNPTAFPWIPDKPIRPYEYALGVINGGRVRTGGVLKTDDDSWSKIASNLPEAGSQDPGVSVAVDFSLKPNETRTLRFVVAWYSPYWPATPYMNMYRLRFNSAQEVAQFLVSNHPAILSRVLAWQQVVYSEKRLPEYLRESLVNILCLMSKGSFYVCNPGADARNGLFTILESVGAVPIQETVPVAWWGDFPVTFLFPELRMGTLRAFAAYQAPDGRIPFILGATEYSLDAPHYVHQHVTNSILYVQMVDRLCARTGDKKLVREFYPSVKRAIKYTMTLSTYNDGLISMSPDEPTSQPFDAWPWAGDAIYNAGHWLASLQIGQRMAEAVGDSDFGKLCQDWISRGRQTMEGLLWNERVGSYFLYATPGEPGRSNDAIMAYQLDGSFHNLLLGLPEEVFPARRVKTVLETVYEACIKPVPAGAVNGANADRTIQKPSVGGQPGGVWVCANAILAAIYAYDGRAEIAKELLKKALSNLVLVRQLGWNFPQGFDDIQGERAFLGNYYWGMALWAAAPALLGQNLRQFCTSGSFTDGILRAASGGQPSVKYVF